MRTKSAQFRRDMHLHDYEIIALSETWFHEQIFSSEFFDENYHVYRLDRSPTTTGLSRGGGVLWAVKANLCSSNVSLNLYSNSIEQLCVKIKFSWNRCIFFLLSYIPPDSTYDIHEKHLNNLASIYNNLTQNDEIMYLGDFNLGNISWLSYNNNLIPSNVKSEIELLFVSTLLSYGLKQINSVLNDNNRILDLAFISADLNSSCQQCYLPILSNSQHHKALLINFEFYKFDKLSSITTLGRNYSKADVTKISEYIDNTDWSFLDSFDDPNTSYSILCDKLLSTISRFVPLRNWKSHRKPPWFNSRLCHLKNLKNKAYKKLKRTNSIIDRDNLLRLKREFNCLHNYLFKHYIFRIESNLKSNPSSFWRYINNKRKTNGFPTCLNYDGIVSDNEQDSCDLFAKFFQKVYEKFDKLDTFNFNVSSPESYDDFTVSTNDVAQAASKLSNSSSTDHEGFCPVFFKLISTSIAKPISILFNKCLNKSIFLDAWKICSITPIYKSGSRNDVCNYRPIVKQSTISKLFDSILKVKMLNRISDLICEYQHGFVPLKSTCTNLALVTHNIINAFVNRAQLDIVYTDFSKAFDKVDHSILIKKLSACGIKGTLLKFFLSYLTGRKLFVKIASSKSTLLINAWSGIPQGTHCGPILFLIFINDLPKIFQYVKCLMFADDVKLFLQISCIEDCSNLQKDLKHFQDWCTMNHLHLNTDKCCVVSYRKKPNPFIYNYFLNNIILSRKEEIKDLGIIFDSGLTFSKHIDYIISKAFSMIGFLRRNTEDFSDPLTLKALYISLVRSRLDYCSLIWNPFYHCHINKIERVQKVFTKYALCKLRWPKGLPSYIGRRKLIGLQSLEDRRIYFSILFVYNLLNFNINCCELLSLITYQIKHHDLRQVRLFVDQRYRTNYALNEPMVRCIRFCNNYPSLDFRLSLYNFRQQLFIIFN